MKKKIIIVISDLHLGLGIHTIDGNFNFREDFLFDNDLIDFIDYYRTDLYSEVDVELVINGDFFEMLETVDYGSRDPLYLTAQVAIQRLEQILEGHIGVFEALKKFSNSKNKSLRFLPGNHDMVLIFPEVQKYLKSKINKNIKFSSLSYQVKDIHIEHGNQYIEITKFDPQNLFITTNNEQIINHDWTSIYCIEFVYPRKTKEHPAPYRIGPFRNYFPLGFHTYFFKSLFYGLAFFKYLITTSIRKTPYGLSFGKTNFQIIKNLFTDWSEILEKKAKEILLKNDKINKVVFGHTHNYKFRKIKNKIYVNTGSWNTYTNLDFQFLGTWKKLLHAYIEIKGDETSLELREWHGIQSPIKKLFQ